MHKYRGQIKIQLPSTYTRVIEEVKDRVLKKYPNTLGLVLIGSVASGKFKRDSDIDIVWINSRKISFRNLINLTKGFKKRVQLAFFTRKQINEIFMKSTTMAHSIKKGIILFQRDNFINKLLEHPLSTPDREWMKEWYLHFERLYRFGLEEKRRNERFHKKYCKGKCHCVISNYLVRATVNFAILFLELNGIVPTTKKEIFNGLKKIKFPEDKLRGVKIALKAHHKDCSVNRDECRIMAKSAVWFKCKLSHQLL